MSFEHWLPTKEDVRLAQIAYKENEEKEKSELLLKGQRQLAADLRFLLQKKDNRFVQIFQSGSMWTICAPYKDDEPLPVAMNRAQFDDLLRSIRERGFVVDISKETTLIKMPM